MNDTYLYKQSLSYAKTHDELTLWQDSHRANIACKQAIEAQIRKDFDGMHLSQNCAKDVLSQYGFKRVNWVLANTIQFKHWDGRFSPANRTWSKNTFLPDHLDRNQAFVVESHPAVLDGFITQVRQAYQEQNLFGPEHCQPNSYESLNYDGQVLVLSPDTLKESCWSQENQLWYAHDGFGCSPNAVGRSIRSTCLWDGETARWNRTDFIGILKEEHLPDWARASLEHLAPDRTTPETTEEGFHKWESGV